MILDPFCGTGTTLIEARLAGKQSIGVEAVPLSQFASKVKLNWSINPEKMLEAAEEIAAVTASQYAQLGIDDDVDSSGKVKPEKLSKLEDHRAKLIIRNSISPLPLHKVLTLLPNIEVYQGESYYDHLRLALAEALVRSISNLRFGPEVGVGKIKTDAAVLSPWGENVKRMANDILGVDHTTTPTSNVFLADSREIDTIIQPSSINAVFTSPPYPNEKDYTRTTRLETVILGFADSMEDIRAYKKELVRSNTRGVYKADTDDEWVDNFPQIIELSKEIENRRIQLGKTSGFERLYHRVTKLYFGGMARHLASLRDVLQPGAILGYVVGDQASYLRVMIRTGQILAEIADSLGYEVVRIDLFRTRYATATKEELREEVLVLRWKG